MFSFFKKKHPFWPQTKWRDWLVLVTGLAVFTGLAASTITKFSIWFDEAFGSYLVRFNLFELTRYTAYDVHPPFYYWLLKGWVSLFGNTELGIRSMSLFFGILTIILAFLLVFRLFGRKAAYISLIFLVLSPIFLRYSQEARMYTLLTTIVLAATYLLVYAQENAKKRWPWIAYGVLVALGMLTQYFTAFVWLAHWAWRLMVIRSPKASWRETKQKFFTKEWVMAHVVAIVLFLPWLPWLVRQFADVQGNGFWIPPVSAATVPDFMTNFLFFKDSSSVMSWFAFGLYVVLIALIYLAIRVYRQLEATQRDSYLLLLVMVTVPAILLVIFSMPPLRPLFIDRYLMPTIVFLPLLIAVSLAFAKKLMSIRGRLLLGITIAALMITGIGYQMTIGNYNKSTKQSNNTRQLLEALRDSKHGQQIPILANTPWMFYESVIYAKPESQIYFADETTDYKFGSLRMLKENDDLKVKDVDKFAAEHESFWLIGNIRGGDLQPLRSKWQAHESVVINDDISKEPLFKATRFSVE